MGVPTLPSLQALRVLDAAARLGSYSDAARELGLTHSAVSHQIAALEEWMGAALFERRGRRMNPTATALSIVARTRPALQTLGEAFGRPAPARAAAGLRVSVLPAFARFWLMPRIAAVPSVWTELISAVETSAELADLESDQIDAAIRYGPGGWPGVQSVRLGAERLFPVARPELAQSLAHQGAAALTEAPLIANAFVGWAAWFEAAGVVLEAPVRPILEVADSGLALDAACAGLGLALGRARFCRDLVVQGKLAPASMRALDEGFAYHLVWRPAARNAAQINALLERLLAEFDTEPITLPG